MRAAGKSKNDTRITNFNTNFYKEVKSLIEESRNNVAQSINSEITLLYWIIGKKIKSEVLMDERAEYGEQTLAFLSEHLTEEYGRGWSDKQLRHCIRFFEVFPDDKIVSALRRQLSWTHIKTIAYIEEPLKRDFYLEMCKMEHWSTRVLQERIDSMLFERTAISKQPDEVIAQDIELLKDEGNLTPDLVFHDPYLLDFLGLSGVYSEKNLGSAIIAELGQFIIELGSDFAFLSSKACYH
ncbi:MAG: hypothetical protein Ta2F_17830 [Termitinemataceae bacterium]|nr:MAG: hypothetical protein Ta2F_17830 [Termitinemataceae bacterium]